MKNIKRVILKWIIAAGLLMPAMSMAQVGGGGFGGGFGSGFGGFDYFQYNAVAAVQDQIGASDLEWAVLEPKLQKVIDTQAVVQSAQNGGFGVKAQNPVSRALTDLQNALTNGATPVQINGNLTVYRAALAKARAENVAAQEDLRNLLTVRQEAIMITLGYLE